MKIKRACCPRCNDTAAANSGRQQCRRQDRGPVTVVQVLYDIGVVVCLVNKCDALRSPSNLFRIGQNCTGDAHVVGDYVIGFSVSSIVAVVLVNTFQGCF